MPGGVGGVASRDVPLSRSIPNLNLQENRRRPPISGKSSRSNSGNFYGQSIASEFFTDDELTFVVGRGLRPMVVLLDVVRRIGLWPTSSREQRSTALNH
jgi:hypothetical protein